MCFSESVRAKSDHRFKRIQHISRMNHMQYDDNPELMLEFKHVLSSTCTFVDNWCNDIISPTTYILYGKKYPSRKSSEEYIVQVKSHLSRRQFRERISEDSQNTQQSHQEWQPENDTTSN